MPAAPLLPDRYTEPLVAAGIDGETLLALDDQSLQTDLQVCSLCMRGPVTWRSPSIAPAPAHWSLARHGCSNSPACANPDGGVCAPASCPEQTCGAARGEQRAASRPPWRWGRHPTGRASSSATRGASRGGNVGGAKASNSTERNLRATFEPDTSRSLTSGR